MTHSKMIENGAKLIRNGQIILTFCYSKTVLNILKKAWKDGKCFLVYTVETQPLNLGRKMAKALIKSGIPVEHFLDTGAHHALQEADTFLFGCHAIDAKGNIINKLGTEALLTLAKGYKIPSYSATSIQKWTPSMAVSKENCIEERPPEKIWKGAPKQIKIHHYGFERCDNKKITGIISEFGIDRPKIFVQKLKKLKGATRPGPT